MTIPSCPVILVVLAFACIGPTPTMAQPTLSAPSLVAAVDGRSFAIADARGRYLAIHFLTEIQATESSEFVKRFVRSAPTVAGVRHIFVARGDPANIRAWAAQFKENAPLVYIDSDGAMARALSITSDSAAVTTSGLPSTVVFDQQGKELFRHTGTSAHDHLSFDAFARRMTQLSRTPAADEYNLPSPSSIAVEGYDLVAYFKLNKAVKGSPGFPSSYRGISYRFSSDEFRRLFAADPERYLPTYGGWCASAMGAKGTKVGIDPTNFKVKDGRLFLFYKSLFGDALKDWNQHEREWEPAADENWKKLTGEAPGAPAAK